MLTKEEIRQALKALGVRPGMALEVHSSLGSLGFVRGGAETVIAALQEAVTESGSLFMPALRLSRELPLSDADRALGITVKIKVLPPDCEHSAMGAIADAFRRMPDTFLGEGVFRICGWGRHGREAMRGGLAYVLRHGGYALLLGVDIYKLTAMHYVENLLPREIGAVFAPSEAARAAYPADEWMIEAGAPPVKAWYTIQERAIRAGMIREGRVGGAKAMLFNVGDVVGLYADALQSDPFRLYGMHP